MRRALYRRYPWLRRVRRRLLWAALVLAAAPQILDAANGWWKAENDSCAVWRVIDGDTVSMRCPDGFHRLRLEAIDTPELSAGCWGELWRAYAAKQTLRWAFVRANEIDLPETGRQDRYDRRLGPALVDGVPASSALIDAGLAVPYIPGDISWCDRIERAKA